jgi:hypothetical protein
MELTLADLTCDNQDDHQAVAFGRWGHRESTRTIDYEPWGLHCQPCLDKERRRSVLGYVFEYVVLDPARQRRPDPDQHDDPTVAGTYFLEPDPADS